MSDSLAGVGVAPSALVADAMGLSRSLLHTWSTEDANLSGCVIRSTKHSTWWSVQKLRDRGFLTKPAQAVSP
jgi:hypothetical protein